MKQNTKYKKTEKGITLVALVVTIIILLVLAGITVASLTGNNGLIGKTGEAKKQTEISEGLEQLEIAVTQSTNKRGNIDITRLAKNLSKINGLKYINAENKEIDVVEDTEIKLSGKFKLKGYGFKISAEGNVSYKKYGTIDNKDIIESPSTYCGKYVTNYNTLSDTGINAQEGQKWQIFLADDTNIYLIASNAVSRAFVPLNYNYDEGLDKTAAYKMWFSNILNQYDTSVQVNQSAATILGKLNKQTKYHEWLSNATLQNNNNQKAVLSMLDSDKWNEYWDGTVKKGYKNSTYAEYAIGGPSLEMFCESYNTTHGGLDVIPKPKQDSNTNNYYTSGYKVEKNNWTDFWRGGLKDSSQTTENTDINNMHFKCHYWISSPSASSVDNVMLVDTGGSIANYAYSYNTYNFCFRPLVCLKSNVHLVKNEDGQTYSLELD